MKTFLRILMIGLIIVSCKEESKQAEVMVKDSYTINGSAPGIYNGVRVYLKTMDNRGRFIDRDTAIVINEKFTFEGKVAAPEKLSIHVNSVNGSIPVMLENDVIEVTVDKNIIANSSISGTKSNDALTKYNKESNKLNAETRALNNAYRTALSNNDTEKANSLTSQLQSLNEQQSQYPVQFIKNHNDNYFSLNLLGEMMNSKTFSITDITEAYEALDEDLLESELGNRISQGLEMKKAEAKRIASLSEGNIAPNFSAPTPTGKTLALNDIKGRATIVDFWAAWCGPCRRENPNVVSVYNKYHDKGLEIIGISLDGSSRQQDPKAAWLKAIEDDGLTWNHVSNLKYFQDPVAQLYNINSIPATYILDGEGKIVAKNLRGKALEDKIAEMLN